jgi:hypothetical protein
MIDAEFINSCIDRGTLNIVTLKLLTLNPTTPNNPLPLRQVHGGSKQRTLVQPSSWESATGVPMYCMLSCNSLMLCLIYTRTSPAVGGLKLQQQENKRSIYTHPNLGLGIINTSSQYQIRQ